MFCLSRQERNVILAIAGLMVFGACYRFFQPSPEPVSVSPASDPGPLAVNINRAAQEDLIRIPGIGTVLAARILAYRQVHGAFTCYEDVKSVKGIGDKKLESLKQYIVFE